MAQTLTRKQLIHEFDRQLGLARNEVEIAQEWHLSALRPAGPTLFVFEGDREYTLKGAEEKLESAQRYLESVDVDAVTKSTLTDWGARRLRARYNAENKNVEALRSQLRDIVPQIAADLRITPARLEGRLLTSADLEILDHLEHFAGNPNYRSVELMSMGSDSMVHTPAEIEARVRRMEHRGIIVQKEETVYGRAYVLTEYGEEALSEARKY